MIQIYLLRHAIAVSREAEAHPNDDRPLTEDGRRKMKKAARGISRIVTQIDLILTSPLVRAEETAEITAQELGAEDRLETCSQLLPGSPQKDLLSFLNKRLSKNLQSILLVGHEPDLGLLASKLLGSDAPLIDFKKGALCRIDVANLALKGAGQLIWHLPPKVLRELAGK